MATIETLKVNKGLKYLVKARSVGYYDHVQVFDGTEEDTSVSVPAMTPYDGLLMTQGKRAKRADVVDFSNTVLPWKLDYQKYLSTSNFTLMPIGDYKYSIYVPNGTIIGTLINDDNVISGFSTSNYITTPLFNPMNSPWEVGMKVTTGSDFSATTAPVIFSSGPDNKYGINLNFHHSDSHKQFNLYCSSDGSSWLFDLYGTHEVQLNATYWLKFGWTGTEYYLDYSLDGRDYIRDITFESNVSIYNQLIKTVIGISQQIKYPFNGSINLNECYAKINNEIVWNGLKNPDNITFVGYPSFNAETMVASNFSTSNYITTPTFNPGNNPWEVKIKIKTGSITTQEATIFMSATSNSDKGIGLMISRDGFFNPFCSANGSTYLFGLKGTHQVQANTTYWLLLGWNGVKYYFKYSTNGVDFIEDVVFSSNSAVFSGITTTLIGIYSGIKVPFNGSIDLSETELLINGETFYKPEVTYITNTIQGCLHNYIDNGQATTLNCFVVNGDEKIVLTPDTSYNNERFLGTVNISEHDVYDYIDGDWVKI